MKIKTEPQINMKNLLDVRGDFPIFSELRNFHYLDSAATAQKPEVVLKTIDHYYRAHNANPRRGVSHVSNKATELVEQARQKVAQFIGTADPSTVVFTKSTTESLNIVAHGWAKTHLKAGDEILLSEMEHHSNLIPWQQAARATGAGLRSIPVSNSGEIDLERAKELITATTKLVAITHVSNVFGSTTPLKKIINLAHQHKAVVVVDGAQAVAHLPINVTDLDADFYAFSGHKLYGPMGVGVLYGKKALLEQTEPLQYGGSMIEHVTYQDATWDTVPHKFEGGTLDVAAIVGLASAINYLKQFSWEDIAEHEQKLIKTIVSRLQKMPRVKLYAPRSDHASVVSFNVEGIHPHDVSEVLDARNVTVRSGHHCAMPIMDKLGISGTVRASIGLYNNYDDVDALISGVEAAIGRFNG